jgi:transcriptional regulator with XRE-family HTH domain
MPLRLGEVIKQARQARRLTLRRLADHVMKEDASPISPQYLVDIEVHHCGPAPRVLREPARMLELDYAALFPVTGGLTWSCGNTFSVILRLKRRSSSSFAQSSRKGFTTGISCASAPHVAVRAAHHSVPAF